MKFYFSGVEAIPDSDLRDRIVTECACRLQSCHGNYIKTAYKWMRSAVELGVAKGKYMLLDSGAFTAWKSGHPTTLKQLLPIYKDIQEKFAHLYDEMWFINLDVIPGSMDKAPTQQDIQQALIDSDINYEILVKELGPCVLPVIHQGEDWDRLEVLKQQSNYICVSPRQTIAEKYRALWCEQVATKADGYELHGLATTGARIIRSADWHSVDSASWVITGGIGTILCLVGGKLMSVSVSYESPNKKDAGKHLTNMPPTIQQVIVAQLEQYGFTLEDVETNPGCRQAFNLLVTQQWTTGIDTNHHRQQGLF